MDNHPVGRRRIARHTSTDDLTAMYRRKAACDHENRYSNICTVYNKSFLSGGTIPELIELNKTGFNRFYFDIPYLTEPSLTASKSTWEVYKNGFWTPFGSDEKHIRCRYPNSVSQNTGHLYRLRSAQPIQTNAPLSTAPIWKIPGKGPIGVLTFSNSDPMTMGSLKLWQ